MPDTTTLVQDDYQTIAYALRDYVSTLEELVPKATSESWSKELTHARAVKRIIMRRMGRLKKGDKLCALSS